MTYDLLASLQKSGFANISQPIFTCETQSNILKWASKKINESNQQAKSIISSPEEIFFPTDMNYSGIRNISRSLSMPMPQKTIIYRRLDSLENGLFIDIINPDTQLQRLREELYSSKCFQLLSEIYQYNEDSVEFHIYYTKSCISPRSWHIDGPTLKIFTYLTDVSVDHGPYAYQLSSHRYYDREIANGTNHLPLKTLKSNVSKQYFNPKNIISPTGIKGTSFISNQSGIHRGLSQLVGVERYVLVVQLS